MINMGGFQLAAVPPQEIAIGDISSFWPQAPEIENSSLKDSIQSLGLLRPLLVFEDKGCPRLLLGARRLEALKQLSWLKAPTVVLPLAVPRKAALALALADKAERGLNAAETALIWDFLITKEADYAEELSPYLGLKNAPKLRQWCRLAACLPGECARFLANGLIDLELAARLSSWPADDRLGVLELFEALAPSKQKKKQWLDWLEDISRGEKISPSVILNDQAIVETVSLAAAYGRSFAESAARQALWKRRHPILAELLKRRERRLKALALPPNLRLELDPSLEDLHFSFKMNFSGLNDYEELLRRLESCQGNPHFRKLLDDSDDPIPGEGLAE